MWITSEPLRAAEARAALAAVVPDLDAREQSGQIEILDYTQWYTLGGNFDSDRVLAAWVDRLERAQKKGFAGLRLTGNTFWLEEANWRAFIDYEAAVDNVISQYNMIALCTYSLDKCGASQVIDVTNHHQFALAKRAGKWEMIESSDRRKALEAQRHAAELEARVDERTRALQISEKRYRSLFECMNEGFALHEIICDDQDRPVDYRFIEVNPAFELLTGLRRDQVVGRTAREVIPQLEDFWVRTYGQVALTGVPIRFENYSAPLDQYYEVFAYSPNQRQFAAVFMNITERKRAEEAVGTALQRIEKLNADLALQAAELQAANVRLAQVAEELQLANLNLEDTLSQEHAARAEAEERRRALEQSERAIESLNRDLEWRARQLEMAYRELEAFSYSVSHDLRTPLRAVENFTGLLVQDFGATLDPVAREYVDLIAANTRQMTLLIDGLLRLSRLERQALERTSVTPVELVHQVLQDLAPQINGRNVHFMIDDLPACSADPVLLRQVYANLLSNAVKFTRKRPAAEIHVGWKQADEDNRTVYFVRDNGIGFDPDCASKLFGVFQRLHSEDDYEGTGIGLALVERIIRRHGGQVWAESRMDEGATFFFTIPTQGNP